MHVMQEISYTCYEQVKWIALADKGLWG